ncbi:histidine kinase [Flavobacterium collinsii]|nr:histidine kinase [Flavobacterium collinsii]
MPLQNRFFYFFIFFSIHIAVFAQYFPSRNYSTADGLPNNAVRALFIDSKNVLWIGTENGVSRLENGSFNNLDQADGLGHNSCWDIAEDTDGNMWFASYGGGVSKFDGKKFTVFTTKNGLLANKTRKVFPYKNKIYVGTEQGVSIIDIKTNQLISPKVPPHKEDFICISFMSYQGNVYFTSIFKGLYKIDPEAIVPKIEPVVLHKNSYSLARFDNNLYSGNEGFIDQYNLEDIKKGILTSKKFGKSFVWEFARDKRNFIFGAAWGVYNTDGGLFKIHNNEMIDVSDYYGIDSKILLNVVYDSVKDVLYVGSNEKGIYEVRLDGMIDFNPFGGKKIIDFDYIGDQKLVLHQNGLSFLNAQQSVTKTISLEDFKNFELEYVQDHKNKNAIQNVESRDFILNFDIPAKGIEFYEMVRHHDSFWIGSNIGIFEVNSKGRLSYYIPKHSLKIGFGYDDKFIETVTYAGTRLYDNVYNLKSQYFSKFAMNTPQFIVKILSNKNKTYLLSVFNGLYVYHNHKFQSYLFDGIWKEKKFKHIAINGKGQLILAAEFGNVFIVEDSKSFKVVKTILKKQLIGNTIVFLEAYRDFILIGTERGVNIYQNGTIRLLDQEQGLKDCAITTSKVFKDKLWLGTTKGFYTIDLKKLLSRQNNITSIAISKITINNVPLSKSQYHWFEYPLKKIQCDYKHNSFLIDFLPKGHDFPKKLKFRYRLNSKDQWSPYSDKTNLFLPNLPFGNYHLEIEVLDTNAGATRIFDVLKIDVTPPFWFTWWFILTVIVLILGFLYFLFLRNRKKNKEKALIQRRIAETKLEALLSQMNPHFMFNAMNNIQGYVMSNDVEKSSDYIYSFAKLMRMTLENSSRQKITVQEEIDYLKLYISIENMRFDNRITVDFILNPEMDPDFYAIPTMLLQPFVENVFVHAFDYTHNDPRLQITFTMLDENILECKIQDNGVGVVVKETVKTHASKGIKLAKERLSLLEGTYENSISIKHLPGHGTTVTICLEV